MHNEKFGDSYDYAKRVLLQTIAEPDMWIAHPMPFYLNGGGLELDDYATFLGLPAKAVMGQRNKGAHLLTPGNLVQDVARFSHNYLFLDPDTGIYDHEVGDTKHITVGQLTKITTQRADKLVLVFDQSFEMGGVAKDKLKKKLELFCNKKPPLHCAGIIVHENLCTCFIWLSTDKEEVRKVTEKIRRDLPGRSDRVVALP